MTARIFSERERQSLSRKPGSIAECKRIRLSAGRLEELLASSTRREFDGSFSGLDRVVAENPDLIEFVAVSPCGLRIVLVNTEGSSYARYAGVVSDSDPSLDSEGASS